MARAMLLPSQLLEPTPSYSKHPLAQVRVTDLGRTE